MGKSALASGQSKTFWHYFNLMNGIYHAHANEILRFKDIHPGVVSQCLCCQDLEFRGSAEATERSERGRLAAAAQTLAAGAVSWPKNSLGSRFSEASIFLAFGLDLFRFI